MSRWARQRQLSYLGVILVSLILAGGVIYYNYQPAATCFDGRQNGVEKGVDCGGACALACREQVLPLKILWSRVLPVSSQVHAAVAMVENPNLREGVRRLRYTFRLVDERNILITYRSGETFANPGEKFVIFEGGIGTGAGRPARAFLGLAPPVWEQVSAETPLLTVEGKTFTNGAPARLTAGLMNRSIIDLPRVEATALLSDVEGNAVSAGATYVENLARDRSAQIFFSWPASFKVLPSFIDIYPRVSVFDLK